MDVSDYTYNPSDIIGHGAFAIVYKGVQKSSNKSVAIKLITKKKAQVFTKEITILRDLKALNHNNLVTLYDVIEDGPEKNVLLIMEYCNGGDLSDYLSKRGKLNEIKIRGFLTQLASAMKALNSRGVVHRDLKPQNILLHYNQAKEITLKIADFGFARCLEDGVMAATLCGSPMYMAPEVIMSLQYDAKADLWSLGTIIYQCLTGKVPFVAKTPQQLKKLYETKIILLPFIPHETSQELTHLLLNLLKRNPRERLGFDELFQHPFLSLTSMTPPRSQSIPVPLSPKISNEKSPKSSPASPLASKPINIPTRVTTIRMEDPLEIDGFVIVPRSPTNSTGCSSIENYPPTKKKLKWAPDIRSMSPPRVNFKPAITGAPKFEHATELSVNTAPTTPPKTPIDMTINFEPPPDLTDEVLFDKEHGETLSKLNFALVLADSLLALSSSKSHQFYKCLQPDSVNFDLNSEQLALHMRALQLLSSALRLAKSEIETGGLHPTKSVKTIVEKLNGRFQNIFILAKKFANAQRNSVSQSQTQMSVSQQCVNADRLIYSSAIEISQSAAMDELMGDFEACLKSYQLAHVLFHSLSQQVGSEAEKEILTRYKIGVEKGLARLECHGLCRHQMIC